MQRFYQPPEAFAGNYINSNDKKFINQLIKVLRAREGERFIIFDNSDFEYMVQLVSLNYDLAKFLIIDKKKNQAETGKEIIIYPSLLKSDKFEWLLQKATELGVKKIVPVISQRSIVKNISNLKKERYGEIVKEATEQCGGAVIPKIDEEIDFDSAIRMLSKEEGLRLIAWEREKDTGIKEIVGKLKANDKIHVFVGPEGGYSDEEISFAIKNGLKTFSLGPRILRAETASIYILSLLASPLL